MLWTRRLCFALLLPALVLGSGTSIRADDPLAGPHAFDDGIAAIRAQLEEGLCAEARDAFTQLLEAHKEKDYVKARRAELQDLMKEVACGASHERPKAKDLVDGDLKSWSPETGKIKITFSPAHGKDLESREGLFWLPARMTGPFTLELKGGAYPTQDAETPLIVLSGDQDAESGKVQRWNVAAGVPVQSGRSAAKVNVTIVHVDGGSEKEVSNRKTGAPKEGKGWKFALKASDKKLAASFLGRSMGSAKKSEALWGYLGFRAGGWTEATLSGEIDPAWIEEKLDVVFRTQLQAFEKDYDEDKFLPGWLAEPLRQTRSVARGKEFDLIGQLDAKFTDQLQEVYNGIRLDEFDAAFAMIDKMQAAGAPEASCEYLRAQARQRMTQLEQAIVHLERCLTLVPQFLEGALLQGQILQQLGRYDEALASFEQAMAGNAQFPRVYEEAANSMMLAGRPESAKRVTQLAARNGVTSETLITLNDALAKVVRGPRWTERFEHKSNNYHVMSNMDQATCREAARILEDAFAAYRVTFGWVPEDKSRLFKVYLFNTREGFLGYMGDLEEFMGKPADQAAGVYSPLLKQLLIWNLPQREEMFNTVRHEGFHQYLDRLMSSPPVWFNEGLAVYHENGKVIDGTMTFGQMHPHYVRLLHQRGMIPLEKFLFNGPSQFYEDGHRSYGQAWLLIHMLQHTTPEYLDLYKVLVKELQAESSYVVLKRHLTEAAIPKIQEDLRRYLEKLGRD